jgi:sulfatase maturation enzyme AslB (radical SAM superfamily)
MNVSFVARVCITVRIDIAVMPATATNMMYPRYFLHQSLRRRYRIKHTLMVNTSQHAPHLHSSPCEIQETCGANLLRHEPNSRSLSQGLILLSNISSNQVNMSSVTVSSFMLWYWAISVSRRF